MSRVFYRLGLVIALIPFLASIVIFLFLPETIPTHFSGADPDAWSDKWSVVGIMSLFTIPLLSLIMFGLLHRIAPGLYKIAKETDQTLDPKHWEITVLIIVTFLLMCQVLIIDLTLSNT